jgi:hypothetical protein
MTRRGSYHTPAGWADRATYRDDTLPHQIRILAPQHLRGSTKLYVACTCEHGTIAEIMTADQALRYWQEAHQPAEVA